FARAFNPASPLASSRTVSIGHVVIETQGPSIARITVDARHGVFDITYVDAVGLNAGSLVNPAAYTLIRGPRALHPTAVSLLSEGTVALRFGKGKKMAPGRYTLTVGSGLVKNAAGMSLDGEFRGILPSGNDVPGGDFQASFAIKGNAGRTVKGPAVVAVTIAQ